VSTLNFQEETKNKYQSNNIVSFQEIFISVAKGKEEKKN
jgi:hypothetical protein